MNITNSNRGIGIFLRDEGSLENLTFTNINIATKLLTGDWWGNGEPIHISAIRGNANEQVKLGQIRNVRFENINCRGENGILVYGTPESVIENLSFTRVRFDFVDSPLNDVAGGNVDLRGVVGAENQLFARDIPGVLAQYVNGLVINDFTLRWQAPPRPFLSHGLETNHVRGLRVQAFEGTAAPGNPEWGCRPAAEKPGQGSHQESCERLARRSYFLMSKKTEHGAEGRRTEQSAESTWQATNKKVNTSPSGIIVPLP